MRTVVEEDIDRLQRLTTNIADTATAEEYVWRVKQLHRTWNAWDGSIPTVREYLEEFLDYDALKYKLQILLLINNRLGVASASYRNARLAQVATGSASQQIRTQIRQMLEGIADEHVAGQCVGEEGAIVGSWISTAVKLEEQLQRENVLQDVRAALAATMEQDCERKHAQIDAAIKQLKCQIDRQHIRCSLRAWMERKDLIVADQMDALARVGDRIFKGTSTLPLARYVRLQSPLADQSPPLAPGDLPAEPDHPPSTDVQHKAMQMEAIDTVLHACEREGIRIPANPDDAHMHLSVLTMARASSRIYPNLVNRPEVWE